MSDGFQVNGRPLRYWVLEKKELEQHIYVNSVSAVHDSIQNGSPVTGAPGQPVGQYGPGYHEGEVGGTLKASWQVEFEAADSALVYTKSVYAEGIEDRIGSKGQRINLRSTVGGFHSVKLTRAGWDRIVDDETKKAVA